MLPLSEEPPQFVYTAWTNPKVHREFEREFLKTTPPNDADILAATASFMMHLPHKTITATPSGDATAAASRDAGGVPFADPDGDLNPFVLYGYGQDLSVDAYGDFRGDVVALQGMTAGADDTPAAAAAATAVDMDTGHDGVGGANCFLMPPRMTQNDNNYVLRCEVPALAAAEEQQQHRRQSSHTGGGGPTVGDGKVPRAVAHADWVRRILAFNSHTSTEPIVQASIVATPRGMHVQCRVMMHANCYPLPFLAPDRQATGSLVRIDTVSGEPRHPRPAEELVSIVAEALACKQDLEAAVTRLQTEYAPQEGHAPRSDIAVTRGVDITGSGLGDDDDDGAAICDPADIPAIASVIVALQALARFSSHHHGKEEGGQTATAAVDADMRTKVAQCRYWYEVRVFADYINVSWDDFRAVGLLCPGGVLWMRVELWPTSSGTKVRPALCVGVPMDRLVHRPPPSCPRDQLPTIDPHGEVGCMRCTTCLTTPQLYSRQIGMYKQKSLHPRPQPRGYIAKMLGGKKAAKSRPAPYSLRK